MAETSTAAHPSKQARSLSSARQVIVGLIAVLVVVAGLFSMQLARRAIWENQCLAAGGHVVTYTDDATPYVAQGSRAIYTCDEPSGRVSTWR